MDRRQFLEASFISAGGLMLDMPLRYEPLQSRIDVAQRIGGEVIVEPGIHIVMKPLRLGPAPITLRGRGVAILRAGAPMDAVIMGNTKSSVISDIVIDGANLAEDGLALSVDPETSTRNTIERVRITGCWGYQFYLEGHEDSTLRDCYTPGHPARGVYLAVPTGAARIVGGALFGQLTLDEYQQVDISGSTFGPLVIVSAEGRPDRTLHVTGSYIYDSPMFRCVDTATNLTNVTLDGCYLVAQTWDAWLNGNLPVGVTIGARQTVFTQAPENTAVNTFLTQTSGLGRIVLDGVVASHNPGVHVTAHRDIAGGQTLVDIPYPILGVD